MSEKNRHEDAQRDKGEGYGRRDDEVKELARQVATRAPGFGPGRERQRRKTDGEEDEQRAVLGREGEAVGDQADRDDEQRRRARG
jgi:hypothetical protein